MTFPNIALEESVEMELRKQGVSGNSVMLTQTEEERERWHEDKWIG